MKAWFSKYFAQITSEGELVGLDFLEDGPLGPRSGGFLLHVRSA